jgi:transposase
MKYYAGLDVSLDETAVCVVNEEGVIVHEGKAESDPTALADWLSNNGVDLQRVGLEAGPLSPWLYEGLRAAGLPAVCVETRRMKGATAAMAVKTDRNDARAIAQAIRVGWYTAVHVKTAESQELRLLLTNRKTLQAAQLALDNEIRGTLKAFGLKVGQVTTARFEGRVTELVADRPRLLAMVRPMLFARDALRRQFAALHRMVLQATRTHQACRRFMTVPGVGPVVALTYATALDAPERFTRSRDVGAHFGLTPRKYASGEIDRNGAISKSGDRMARQALFHAALSLMTRAQRWSPLRAWGLVLAKRRGLKRATVAVARKLAVLLHRLWTDQADFRWTREEAVAA